MIPFINSVYDVLESAREERRLCYHDPRISCQPPSFVKSPQNQLVRFEIFLISLKRYSVIWYIKTIVQTQNRIY